MNPDFQNHFELIASELSGPGYVVVDDFLTPEEVEGILEGDEFKVGMLQFNRAGTGIDKVIQEDVRGDYIRWIDKENTSPEVMVYLLKLQGLSEYLNRALFLSLKDSEIHATVYPPGAFYKRHLDQFKTSDRRKLSVICYLNTNWLEGDGGQLRLYVEQGSVDVYPIAGRLVCFRSDQLEHEVMAATRNRLSLTGWLRDQPL